MPAMKKSSRGFTLPELMVVLALAAMILAIGVPAFRDFQRNNRLTVAANDVLGMIITSRAEALRRQTVVSMCPSATPNDDDATCGAGTGWIVFDDPNANCILDDGETKVAGMRVDDDVGAVANSDCISFATNGFRRIVDGEPTTAHMLYCDDRGNVPRNTGGTDSTARGVEVLPTGRGMVVKAVAELEAWDAGDDAVACP
jgi:type IV fimbrial biogenesis protein FimT